MHTVDPRPGTTGIHVEIVCLHGIKMVSRISAY